MVNYAKTAADGVQSKNSHKASDIPILDVRHSDKTASSKSEAPNTSDEPATPDSESIRDQIVAGLAHPGTKKWPTAVLFDERGLKLYDTHVTRAPQYYPYQAEMRILRAHASEVVQAIREHAAGADIDKGAGCAEGGQDLVELGSGSLKKTALLLSAFARQTPAAITDPRTALNRNRYYALDLDRHELERTLGELRDSAAGAEMEGKISTAGLWGAYEDGLRFIAEGGLESLHETSHQHRNARQPEPEVLREDDAESPPPSRYGRPLHLLFLGTTIGNFAHRSDAATFLRSLPLRPVAHSSSGSPSGFHPDPNARDTLLIGIDQNDDPGAIKLAYNDPHGHARTFMMNALVSAGRVLGDERLFREEDWAYEGRYDPALRRYEFYFRSTRAQTVVDPLTGAHYPFREGERIFAHVSYKFSASDAHALFAEADLCPIRCWRDEATKYSLWLLERRESTNLPAARELI
ncbi:histidine-specific methyltransferase [Cubamyces menziesii]|nr:histidine-specific methyltransferase [Cubamyces menziesii]